MTLNMLKMAAQAQNDDYDDDYSSPKAPMSMKCLSTYLPTSNSSKVRFHKITVYEHACMLGDNPSVTISWKCQAKHKSSVNSFETQKLNRKPRHGNALRLSSHARAQVWVEKKKMKEMECVYNRFLQ